jgi:hypothetical protein
MGLKLNWERRPSLLGEPACRGEPMSIVGVPMRRVGETAVREEGEPVWSDLMLPKSLVKVWWDSMSYSWRLMAPFERTRRAVMRRDLSRKTKLCYTISIS